jgi:hypothetical protein
VYSIFPPAIKTLDLDVTNRKKILVRKVMTIFHKSFHRFSLLLLLVVLMGWTRTMRRKIVPAGEVLVFFV